MGKHTAIQKINICTEYIDYHVHDNDVIETSFFIRIMKTKKIVLCSTHQNFCDYFYMMDLNQPDYRSIPLTQHNVSSRVFTRAMCRIIKATENDQLVDDLSISN